MIYFRGIFAIFLISTLFWLPKQKVEVKKSTPILAKKPKAKWGPKMKARIIYNIVDDALVTVKYDKHNERSFEIVLATNRPDKFEPLHNYAIFIPFKEKRKKCIKVVTRQVLDKPKITGGEPNLEIYISSSDQKTRDFLEKWANNRQLEVREVL